MKQSVKQIPPTHAIDVQTLVSSLTLLTRLA